MRNSTSIILFSQDKAIVEKVNSFLAGFYHLETVSSASELENINKKNNDCVIIIDSDTALCSKLKSNDNACNPIILLMNADSSVDINEVKRSGADIYLESNFSKTELLSSINFLINDTREKKHLKQLTSVTKESEQKYKRLFQLSPDGIGYHVGGKIGFINEAGIKILGANSFEEVFGKYFLDFVHPFDKEYVFNKIRNDSKEKHLFYETRIIALNGQTKYIDVSSTPFELGGVNAVQFIIRDITEKKLNQLNLIETNERLEFIQKIARLGYWEFDIKNNQLIWSKDIYELLSLSEKDFNLSLKNFLNLIHPDDREIFHKAFEAALSGLVSLDIEHRIVKKDNSIIFVNQRGAAVYDERGNPVKFSGSVQDITDRKQMENALRESQTRLSNIINSAMDAVITIDENHNILLFNITAEQMFGYKASDVYGKKLDMFIPPKYREIHQLHINKFGETGITTRSMGALNPISGLRANGEEFPIEASISQVEVNGQKLYTVIIRDITEKKKAEEALISSEARYRLLFKKNPLPMWVYDVETLKFLAVNFAAVKVYGYTSDEFLSMKVIDITPEEDVPTLKEFIKDIKKPFSKSGVWRHRKKDGTIIDVEVISHEIEFDGRPARLVLANDITEKKKAEDELRHSREQLRQLAGYLQKIREEERAAIAREIHDELGQVLTSLKMNLIFVDKKIKGNGNGFSINDIHNEISGMTSIIDNSVKRIRKIITELRPEMLDQLGLIPALEWQVKEFKAKSGIECNLINNFGDVEINRNISIAVYRIFQEALTNVMRHSKATEVDIKINKVNNHIELEISDNGIGIEKREDKPKSFGVIGMRERAIILGGEFKLEPNIPSGTKILVNIPLDES